MLASQHVCAATAWLVHTQSSNERVGPSRTPRKLRSHPIAAFSVICASPIVSSGFPSDNRLGRTPSGTPLDPLGEIAGCADFSLSAQGRPRRHPRDTLCETKIEKKKKEEDSRKKNVQGYVLFRVRRVFGAHLEVPCLYTCANFEKKVRRLLANQKENEQINDNENSCAVLSANRVIVLHGHTSGPRVLVAWRGQLPTADVLNGCARCAGDKCDKRALSRSLIWLPAHSD